jgi:hypothetical protein
MENYCFIITDIDLRASSRRSTLKLHSFQRTEPMASRKQSTKHLTKGYKYFCLCQDFKLCHTAFCLKWRNAGIDCILKI